MCCVVAKGNTHNSSGHVTDEAVQYSVGWGVSWHKQQE